MHLPYLLSQLSQSSQISQLMAVITEEASSPLSEVDTPVFLKLEPDVSPDRTQNRYQLLVLACLPHGRSSSPGKRLTNHACHGTGQLVIALAMHPPISPKFLGGGGRVLWKRWIK